MFVGSVYWLLNMCTELADIRVTIFDCTSEDVVWDSKNYDGLDITQEVTFQGFGEYEVCSYDLFTDKNNKICLEINIEMECDG